MKGKKLKTVTSFPRYNPYIDIARFISSLFVVAIHYPPLHDYEWPNLILTHCIARLSVPFFFIVAGYYLFVGKPAEGMAQQCLYYAKRMMRLYLLWTAVYLPIILLRIIPGSTQPLRSLAIWIKECIFSTSYNHLWYVNASIVAALLVMVCMQARLSFTIILVIGGFLYLIGLLPQTYTGLLYELRKIRAVNQLLIYTQKLILTTRNGLFEGFFCFSLGAWLSVKKGKHLSATKRRFLLIVSALLFISEVIVLHLLHWDKEHDMYLFLVPVSAFGFLSVLQFGNETMPWRCNTKYFRKVSNIVFFIHPLIGILLQMIMPSMVWPILFTLVSIISLFIASCILFISNKKHLGWLKLLYE